MLLCLLWVLSGLTVVSEGLDIDLAEDVELDSLLPEDIGSGLDLGGAGMAVPELNLASDELEAPVPEASAGGTVQSNYISASGEYTLNNDTISDNLQFEKIGVANTLYVYGENTINGDIMSIANDSSLMITGGGTLTVNAVPQYGYKSPGICTNNNLLIDGVTLKGSAIWAHDSVTIQNSVVEITDPSEYGVAFQNYSSNPNVRKASMTIINSRVIFIGALSCENDLTLINSTLEIHSADGEETYSLINVKGKLTADGLYAYYRRKGEENYHEYQMEKNDDGTYKVDSSLKYDQQGIELVISPEKKKIERPKIENMTMSCPSLGSNPSLLVGKKATFKVEVTPAEADQTAIKWNVSNKDYASITQDGKLTAKAKGAGKTVTVTAKATDGSGVKATMKVKIVGKVTGITLKPSAKTVKAGEKVTIKATVKAQKGANKALKWSVSNTKYATISQKGVLTTKKAGAGKTVTVTAKAKDGSGVKATVKIKIK